MTRIYEITGVVLLVLAALQVLTAVLLVVLVFGFGAPVASAVEVAIVLGIAALLFGGSRWCGRQADRARATAPRAT